MFLVTLYHQYMICGFWVILGLTIVEQKDVNIPANEREKFIALDMFELIVSDMRLSESLSSFFFLNVYINKH